MKRNYNDLTAIYLRGLGILNLLGLNLGGVLYLWLAGKIKEKSMRARRFLIFWLLIFCPLLGMALILASFALREPIELKVFNFTQSLSWPVAVGFVLPILGIHAIPGVWLCRKDVREQYFDTDMGISAGGMDLHSDSPPG